MDIKEHELEKGEMGNLIPTSIPGPGRVVDFDKWTQLLKNNATIMSPFKFRRLIPGYDQFPK